MRAQQKRDLDPRAPFSGMKERVFQEQVLEPLLRALGLFNVRDNGGSWERGKDIIANSKGTFGRVDLVAIQVKRDKLTGKSGGSGIGRVLVQLRQLKKEPVRDPATNTPRAPDKVFYITPFPISEAARQNFATDIRAAELEGLQLVDGIDLLEAAARHIPDALGGLAHNAEYRANLRRHVAQIPEAAVALVSRRELTLDAIYVDLRMNNLMFEETPGWLGLAELGPMTLGAATSLDLRLRRMLSLSGRLMIERTAAGRGVKGGTGAAKPKVGRRRTWHEYYVNLEPVGVRLRSLMAEVVRDLGALRNSSASTGVCTAAVRKAIEYRALVRKMGATAHYLARIELPKGQQKGGTDVGIPAEGLARVRSRVLITGGPGSGKTTFLRHLAGTLAASAPEVTPVYVPLIRVGAPTYSGLLDAVKDQLRNLRYARGSEMRRKDVQALMLTGRLVLLLDGLDETGSRVPLIMNAIGLLLKNSPETPLFVTYRTTFGELDWPEAFAVKLCSFTPEELKSFVGKWFTAEPGKCTSLMGWLEETPTMREIAQVPLYAALLCSLMDVGADLPTTESQLYENRFDLLLGRWQRAKGISPMSEAARKRFMHFLMNLAYRLHANGDRAIEYGACRRYAARFSRGWTLSASEIIEECVQRGILERDERGDVGFGHLTNQEYLAARYLVARNPIRHIVALLEHGWWRKVLRFYATERMDISDLLHAVIRSASTRGRRGEIEALIAVAPLTDEEAVAGARNHCW